MHEYGFGVIVRCDLDVGHMTLGQGHGTPLIHRQQLCEMLSRSNMAVRNYGLDKDFGYVCTVTLTLGIRPWVKLMTRRWFIDNNCVKYRTRGIKDMAWARCEQTDGQTDKRLWLNLVSDTFIYLRPKLKLSQNISDHNIII